jgi:ferredoxin
MTQQTGLIYFSAGKSTKTIGETIARGMKADHVKKMDITPFNARDCFVRDFKPAQKGIDCLIIGAPVYSGKLPLVFIDMLEKLDGQDRDCIAYVVYGNRDFGIALHQMVNILVNNGFNVVGAAAFIGQHSYSDIVPAGMGRPDKSDLLLADEFGRSCAESNDPITINDIPVQLDKMSGSKKYTSIKPVFIERECKVCGLCGKKCPMGILSAENGEYRKPGLKKLCIGCMGCVKVCQTKARLTTANFFVKAMMKKILRNAIKQRKEPIMIVH